MKLKQVCNHPAQFLGDGSALPERSGKLMRLTEMLEEARAVRDRALIFTQFAEMGSLLKTYLQDTFGDEVFFLHGGTPAKARTKMVETLPERSARPADLHPLDQSGRHGPEPDARQSRLPFRSVVESRRGESGDRSRVSHRADQERAGAQVSCARARSKKRSTR